MGVDLDLWQGIAQHDFDAGAHFGHFVEKLAHENRWDGAFAARVVSEYRRFVYLCCTADHVVVPSDQVDQAWHQHLLDTEQYWGEFCKRVLKRPLHHHPNKSGGDGLASHLELYRRTLETYDSTFNGPAPQDIWPEPAKRFTSPAKPRLRLVASIAGVSVALIATAIGFPFAYSNPFAFTGLSVLIGIVTWRLSRTLAHRLLPQEAGSPACAGELDQYDVATLNTTTQRAVNAAVAALVRDGVLDVDPTAASARKPRYRLVCTGSPPTGAHPLERAVWDEVAKRPDGITLSDVHRSTRQAASELLDSLRGRGLLRRGTGYGSRRLVAMSPVLGLLAFVVLRQCADPARILVTVCVVTAICALSRWMTLKDFPERRTRAGELALNAHLSHHQEVSAVGRDGLADGRAVAWSIAMQGATVLAGGTLQLLSDAILAPSSRGGGGQGVKTAGRGGGAETKASGGVRVRRLRLRRLRRVTNQLRAQRDPQPVRGVPDDAQLARHLHGRGSATRIP